MELQGVKNGKSVFWVELRIPEDENDAPHLDLMSVGKNMQGHGHRQLSTMLKWWRCLQSLAAARQHAFYRGEQIDVLTGKPPGFAGGRAPSARHSISVAEVSTRISSGWMMNEELRSIGGPFGEGAEKLGISCGERPHDNLCGRAIWCAASRGDEPVTAHRQEPFFRGSRSVSATRTPGDPGHPFPLSLSSVAQRLRACVRHPRTVRPRSGE